MTATCGVSSHKAGASPAASPFYFFDTKEAEQGADHVSLGIGAGSLINGAIVDKNCRIGDGVRIENSTGHEDFQSPDGAVIIRDGIPIVVKDSTLPEGWTLKP